MLRHFYTELKSKFTKFPIGNDINDTQSTYVLFSYVRGHI